MHSMSLPILSMTHDQFAQDVLKRLGKGYQHALLVYEEFFRTGTITGSNPAFKNAKDLLQAILELVDLSMPEWVKNHDDGATSKFLLRTHDAFEIEAVCIPTASGGTLCVSSQVGCRMGCTFCETGRMGLLRNLTPDEIISQIFVARHQLGFSHKNIVFMGMGEPFDNYDAVMQAVRVLQDPKGWGYGRRHITISTSGRVDGIEKLIQEGVSGPNLAVSLNAPTDAVRTKLMPINRKYDMKALHATMQKYCEATEREILVAYVLMRDCNDALSDADALADYLQGLNVKVNLIPYNPQSCDRFSTSEDSVVQEFADRLRARGYYTLLRVTKGRDIMAACGQLGNVQLRKKRMKYEG